MTSLSLFTFMHWRRKWQPTPVFLPGESQGWWSLMGCHLWGCTESDMTEVTQQQQQQQPFKGMSELHLVSLNSLPTVSEVSGRTQLVNSLLSGFIVPHWLMSNVSRTTLSGIFVPIKKKKSVSGERINRVPFTSILARGRTHACTAVIQMKTSLKSHDLSHR